MATFFNVLWYISTSVIEKDSFDKDHDDQDWKGENSNKAYDTKNTNNPVFTPAGRKCFLYTQVVVANKDIANKYNEHGYALNP